MIWDIFWAIFWLVFLDHLCIGGLFSNALADRFRGHKRKEEE